MRNVADLLEEAARTIAWHRSDQHGSAPDYSDHDIVELLEAADELRYRESLPPLPLLRLTLRKDADETRERVPSPDPQPPSGP